MIPISVIICTKNEAVNLPPTLSPLIKNFDEVIVVDSVSEDDTPAIARNMGATVINFKWNGAYPKKRQWVLDNVPIKHDWVLMIDADEIVTDEFINDLKSCDYRADGYFVSSQMVWRDRFLNHGMRNSKLCLFKKSVFHFPVIDDLGATGMGEIEGHYQPVPRGDAVIQSIPSPIIHHDREGNWDGRHDNYIAWEVFMNRHSAWPKDPIAWRQFMKSRLRASYLRPLVIFLYGYVLKLGFLDGVYGFDYAVKRARYTWRIVRATRQTNSLQ